MQIKTFRDACSSPAVYSAHRMTTVHPLSLEYHTIPADGFDWLNGEARFPAQKPFWGGPTLPLLGIGIAHLEVFAAADMHVYVVYRVENIEIVK